MNRDPNARANSLKMQLVQIGLRDEYLSLHTLGYLIPVPRLRVLIGNKTWMGNELVLPTLKSARIVVSPAVPNAAYGEKHVRASLACIGNYDVKVIVRAASRHK